MQFQKIILLLVSAVIAEAQVNQFPYLQNFDSTLVPVLPPGWSTTTNRSASGDFTTTKSTPYSDSNVVISTNATISQCLISPLLDLSGKEADSLKFYERRSSSHNSGILIEASTDGGITFPVLLSDTLKNPGTTSYVLRKLKLGDLLSNQLSVKIRWRVVGDGTGTSGTIRFDDITISARYHTDAAISRINFFPVFPIIGDSVYIIATVKNAGIQTIQNIPIEFYNDANNNLQPEPEEIFGTSFIGQPLLPGDTMQSQCSLKYVRLGEHQIIVRSLFSEDQNKYNDLERTILSVGYPPQTVIINEIMYAPPNPEPEWIEIFNNSTDTINLIKWSMSNHRTISKHPIALVTSYLKPNQYCIITKDISLFTAIHADISAPIFQSSTMPTYLFNNTGDAVVLFDHRGAIMDSVHYFPSWSDIDNTSLERIEHHINSNDSLNWGPSGDSSGSTPGSQNYLTPLENDIRIVRVYVKSFSVSLSSILMVVKNTGHQPVQNFSASLFHDDNNDSVRQESELLETKTITTFFSFNDSLLIDFDWSNPPSGRKKIIAAVNYSEDMRPSDNILIGEIHNAYPLNTLIINEIMYEPKTGDAEYVELFNPGKVSVDIQDWKLSDFNDSTLSKKYILSSSSFILGSDEYLLVAFDSSIYNRFPYLLDSSDNVIIKQGSISLNNDGDDIILIDLTSIPIDSIRYDPSWHNPDIDDVQGRSLERINPSISGNDRRNWSTSANPLGGSPGKQNSLYTTSQPTNASISFSLNPFSPDGDGYEDMVLMSYHLPSTTAIIRIQIYDANGRLVRLLADCEPSGSIGGVIWDGYNDRRERVRMGIYIVLVEALDGFGGDIETVKGTIVVAVKL